ncbi:HNH endonuclease [Williamsia soli]|uniref:HNH endonuclease n=1 Tax=Williamsia soli TaxID=364929 RepID=UPI0027DCB525|nr:HNH endonuclease [Williamsia soli]
MHDLDSRDPLALGQQLMSVLESGRRTATYKLATLLALLEFAVEHAPGERDAAVDVDLDDLAERVIALYWRQVRDLDGHYLKQTSQKVARIPDAVRDLKQVTSPSGDVTLEVARRRGGAKFLATRDLVRMTLVQQPLLRLQRVGSDLVHECFLYDDTWMRDNISAKAVADHGNALRLFPGVCFALARLSALLKPALQIAWVNDVRKLNHFLDQDVPDLPGHLFGIDRISLDRARVVLTAEFGQRCFYCDAAVSTGAHVDHVLPWSRVGIDGLANLVLACPRCNSNKSSLLPAPLHVFAALDRGRERLDALAQSIDWPCQFDRTAAAARGLYATQPTGTPIWNAVRDIHTTRSDFDWNEARGAASDWV